MMWEKVRKQLKTIGKPLTSLSFHPITRPYIYKTIVCIVIIYDYFITFVISAKKKY